MESCASLHSADKFYITWPRLLFCLRFIISARFLETLAHYQKIFVRNQSAQTPLFPRPGCIPFVTTLLNCFLFSYRQSCGKNKGHFLIFLYFDRLLQGEIFTSDLSCGKELLGAFVSELFLSVAEQERNEYRRQKQAEGIAAAKARGVRFGPEPKPLPDNFDECYEAWKDGRLSIRRAAEECGLSKTSVQNAAARRAQAEGRAG